MVLFTTFDVSVFEGKAALSINRLDINVLKVSLKSFLRNHVHTAPPIHSISYHEACTHVMLLSRLIVPLGCGRTAMPNGSLYIHELSTVLKRIGDECRSCRVGTDRVWETEQPHITLEQIVEGRAVHWLA